MLDQMVGRIKLSEFGEAHRNPQFRRHLQPHLPTTTRQLALIEFFFKVSAKFVVNVESEAGHAMIDLVKKVAE